MSKNFEFFFEYSCTYITLNHFLSIIHWAFWHDLIRSLSWTIKTSQLLDLISIFSLDLKDSEIPPIDYQLQSIIQNRETFRNRSLWKAFFFVNQILFEQNIETVLAAICITIYFWLDYFFWITLRQTQMIQKWKIRFAFNRLRFCFYLDFGNFLGYISRLKSLLL